MPNMKKIKVPNYVLVLAMIVLVIVATFGTTYAYFKAKLFNLESSQTLSLSGGTMTITYNGEDTTGNSPSIVATGIIPGWKTTKTFTLTGENNTSKNGFDVDNKMYYKIGVVVEENTFSAGSIHYLLTKDASSSSNGEMANNVSGVISTSGTTWIGSGYFNETTSPENHKYNLEISYPDDGTDQSMNNGKSFKAYITVKDELSAVYNAPKAVEFITNLYNTDASSNGLFKDPTDDQNIRYTGATPKNYISFNNELWRIVGVFNVKDSADQTTPAVPKIKIVKDSFLGSYSWDTTESTVNNGYGYNDWTTSDLKSELNGDYLDTTLTENKTWYNGQNNVKTGTFDYTNVIKAEYQNMISESVWNLGGNVYSEPSTPPYGLPTLGQYNAERGTITYNDSRPTIWTGKVALIYPSDYGYASTDAGCRENLRNGLVYVNETWDFTGTTCKNDNWLFTGSWYWTLSPNSGFSNNVFIVDGNGFVNGNDAYDAGGVRPSVYLDPNVKISSGDGTSSLPYKLEY